MLKVLSLFSGIGAFEKALENLKVEHEVIKYCEIDKLQVMHIVYCMILERKRT